MKTSIEWTDATWNPALGCSMARGSETGGCLNCYAARMAMRNLWPGEAYARMTKAGPRWTGKVELRPERLDAPLHWKKPRRVFVDSMSDLFHEALSFEDIACIYGVMALTDHTYQVLTKRPARRLEFHRWLSETANEALGRCVYLAKRRLGLSLDDGPYAYNEWPLPNVWEGVSCEDQRTADERIPLLLQTPAAVRFVSLEPLLAPVDLSVALEGTDYSAMHPMRPIDWVICGGESGPKARPCDVAWIRSIVRQCREAGVACFVKQVGALVAMDCKDSDEPCEGDSPCYALRRLKHPKGGDPSEWPADLRVRELPR